MQKIYKISALVLVICILAACGERRSLAPVSEVRWQPYMSHSGRHVVMRGETLYAIAFRYDTDFRRLARLNQLRPPYALRVGQVLRVQPGVNVPRQTQPGYRPNSSASKPAYRPQPQKPVYTPMRWFSRGNGWQWPVRGRIVSTFIPAQGKKGINIACKKGERIRASSAGVVAYSGSGLQGYGNLIIIKHDNEFLTAYGNNARNLVREGQRVSAGQEIAEAGVVERKYWGVHFEIRKRGIPVNPLSYLK